MNLEYDAIQREIQQKVYERLIQGDPISYSQVSLDMFGRVIDNTIKQWDDKYELVQTVLPLVWWKDWINRAVRCLPRHELYVLFKYDYKLEWKER